MFRVSLTGFKGCPIALWFRGGHRLCNLPVHCVFILLSATDSCHSRGMTVVILMGRNQILCGVNLSAIFFEIFANLE